MKTFMIIPTYAVVLLMSGLFGSISAHAVSSTSLRTAQGDLVSIGDSRHDLFQKMGKTRAERGPRLMDNGRRCQSSIYRYQIDQQRYAVSVCHDRVVQIDWSNQ